MPAFLVPGAEPLPEDPLPVPAAAPRPLGTPTLRAPEVGAAPACWDDEAGANAWVCSGRLSLAPKSPETSP